MANEGFIKFTKGTEDQVNKKLFADLATAVAGFDTTKVISATPKGNGVWEVAYTNTTIEDKEFNPLIWPKVEKFTLIPKVTNTSGTMAGTATATLDGETYNGVTATAVTVPAIPVTEAGEEVEVTFKVVAASKYFLADEVEVTVGEETQKAVPFEDKDNSYTKTILVTCNVVVTAGV